MKVQIVYSSLSGCTRRLAEGIFDSMTVDAKELCDLAAASPNSTATPCCWATGWTRAAPTPP